MAVPSHPAPQPTPAWRRGLLLGAFFLAVVAGLLWGLSAWLRHRPGPPAPSSGGPADPRALYDGPFRNIAPEVAYVGDAACASCHREISTSFHTHPMGRSLAPMTPDAVPRRLLDGAHHNPFRALDALFRVECDAGGVRNVQTRKDRDGTPLVTFTDEVHYVVGSGTRGQSYLTSRSGYLYQTPISWFGQKQRWDLAPGFGEGSLSGRPVGGECLFCHANQAHFREDSLNHYDPPVFSGHAIGCERCHGPGERHAASADAADIVSPSKTKLSPVLRDAICEQCHLEGEARVLRRGRGLYDFRPGMPLEEFWSIFVHPAEGSFDGKAVNHVEQMHLSRCYQGSRGADKLTCLSCHEPHERIGPERRARHYRQRCLSCHEDRAPSCSLDRQTRLRLKQDSCIDCHMPRFGTADIVHTAATDHRILRRPVPLSEDAAARGGPIVRFHGGAPATDPELRRDLGIALVKRMSTGPGASPDQTLQAAELLEEALHNAPDDVAAWEALGTVGLLARHWAEALSAFENALQQAPGRESCLQGAAVAAQNLGQIEKSIGYWRQAVKVNPSLASHRANLTRLLAHTRDWEAVRPHCEAWLRLEPWSIEARKLWIECLQHEGRSEEAGRQQALLDALQRRP
jgi:hypothetical protein